jgi:hypothetical protein
MPANSRWDLIRALKGLNAKYIIPYLVMLCLDCTFGVFVEVSSATCFLFVFTVLLCSLFCPAFPPVGKVSG